MRELGCPEAARGFGRPIVRLSGVGTSTMDVTIAIGFVQHANETASCVTFPGALLSYPPHLNKESSAFERIPRVGTRTVAARPKGAGNVRIGAGCIVRAVDSF